MTNTRRKARPAWWSRARVAGRSEQGGTPGLVPVWRELLCDGDTPVGVYARLRAHAKRTTDNPLRSCTYMLESVGSEERWARYSVVGIGCRARIVGVWKGGELKLDVQAAPGFKLPQAVIDALEAGEGLDAIAAMMASYRSHPYTALPRFWGGLVGVWGHDVVRCFEALREPETLARDQGGEAQEGPRELADPKLPAIDLIASDTLVVFDNFSQRVQVIATACPELEGGYEASVAAARTRIDSLVALLGQREAVLPRTLAWDAAYTTEPSAPWTSEGYRHAVQKAREYIEAGDIFQVVLAQTFDRPREGLDPLDVYRMLRVSNPAPYMYLLDLPSASLAGASPEVLVRVDDEAGRPRVTVRPLAGTRRRGVDEEEDLALERELLADPKERAEHLMLVDLGRNDVGRVAVPGTVRTVQRFEVERYSKVMHIVSEVQGILRPELTALDALRATFPAGTLSGAPKVRALEVIDELELAPRGWYGGAVGYLGYDGSADFAICIRSVVLEEDRVRVQAGAGIVFDSRAEAEDQECHNKAHAVLRGISMARESQVVGEVDS
ncbi:MAG: anthranilate synthase component I family protein [Nannocystaceae bacterium]